MSRTSRFFKFALIVFLAVICLMLVTKNRNYETLQLINFKSETPFDNNNQELGNGVAAKSDRKELQGSEELRKKEEVEDEQKNIAEEQAEDGEEEQADEVEQNEDPGEPPDDKSLPGVTQSLITFE